eukprot:9868678-Karenia_brevis.AAC.1
MAKQSQQVEYQQEMQRGVLDQHQVMITRIEEAINESAIRVNGFYGSAFALTPNLRQMVSDMLWEVDKKQWHQLTEQMGQMTFYESRGAKLTDEKLQCRSLYQANK